MLIQTGASGFIHPHGSEITPEGVYLRRRELLQWAALGGMTVASGSAFAKAVNEAGYEHAVLWDIDSTDAKKIIKTTKNGSIILLHGRKRDLRALKTILSYFQEQGYEMVTVSELLHIVPAAKANEQR